MVFKSILNKEQFPRGIKGGVLNHVSSSQSKDPGAELFHNVIADCLQLEVKEDLDVCFVGELENTRIGLDFCLQISVLVGEGLTKHVAVYRWQSWYGQSEE
jgi:hypothetical protein